MDLHQMAGTYEIPILPIGLNFCHFQRFTELGFQRYPFAFGAGLHYGVKFELM